MSRKRVRNFSSSRVQIYIWIKIFYAYVENLRGEYTEFLSFVHIVLSTNVFITLISILVFELIIVIEGLSIRICIYSIRNFSSSRCRYMDKDFLRLR